MHVPAQSVNTAVYRQAYKIHSHEHQSNMVILCFRAKFPIELRYVGYAPQTTEHYTARYIHTKFIVRARFWDLRSTTVLEINANALNKRWHCI